MNDLAIFSLKLIFLILVFLKKLQHLQWHLLCASNYLLKNSFERVFESNRLVKSSGSLYL